MATLRRMFRFVVWKSGEIGEAVTVNKASVLCHEIPSVFVTGSWPLFITISVARSSVGMASTTFGELEIPPSGMHVGNSPQRFQLTVQLHSFFVIFNTVNRVVHVG